MNAPLIQSTELHKDLTFLEDQLQFWNFDFPHLCQSKHEDVQAVYKNIQIKGEWYELGGLGFDWKDYFLCQLNDQKIHVKHGYRFMDFLAGGSLIECAQVRLERLTQTIRATREFVKWLPNLYGRNVKYIAGRIAEKSKEYGEDNQYCRVWRGRLNRALKNIAHCRPVEVKAPEAALSKYANEQEVSVKNRSIQAAQYLEWIEELNQIKDRYSNVVPELPEVIPSAKVYRGQVTYVINTEAAQKWASALSWLSDREELNRAVYQLMLETGEMIRDNDLFTEGRPREISVVKDGYTLGIVNYELVCKTCGQSGGGKCPDCGTCAGYS